MLIQDVLKHPARTMSEAKREQFVEEGCCVVEGLMSPEWVARLKAAMEEMVDASRRVAQNDGRFILEDGHSAETPRLRRLTSPVAHHPSFWEFASQSASAGVAVDVCGPDVKFYHSKLNFKWPGGGQRFDWHQDIQAWPHTDYSPVTIGLYLEDCGPEQGPLLAIRGSHKGELYSMYDKDRNWVLRIPEDELPEGWRDDTVALTGLAGPVELSRHSWLQGQPVRPHAPLAAERLQLGRFLRLRDEPDPESARRRHRARQARALFQPRP